ncbi:MAG: protein phosphatase CheZ [Paucimonas sp.]|jgi:chemotaxis protein CheZ|nr:protein phosphatase CheZ [Paucimonas sp.]
MDHNESSLGDFESTLKKHAQELVASLERGQFGDAVQLIHQLNQTRDRGLYQEVGKLTRELHSAIVSFQIDTHGPQAEEMSQITDATERLAYVVKLTEAAANRTMDLVEQGTPVLHDLGEEARALQTDWQRFMRKEVAAPEFRELVQRVDRFLARSAEDSHKVGGYLNDILLAQDFQDLTGQVIKRVTSLVTEVEKNLLKLVLMASQVDRFAGIEHDRQQMRDESDHNKHPTRGEGPQIHADKREDVVSGQDDVDDLLSSLGF